MLVRAGDAPLASPWSVTGARRAGESCRTHAALSQTRMHPALRMSMMA